MDLLPREDFGNGSSGIFSRMVYLMVSFSSLEYLVIVSSFHVSLQTP